MSIASDYAKSPLTKAPPRLVLRGPLGLTATAWVTTDGYLFIGTERLTPIEALKLAEWLQRTFREGGHD